MSEQIVSVISLKSLNVNCFFPIITQSITSCISLKLSALSSELIAVKDSFGLPSVLFVFYK